MYLERFGIHNDGTGNRRWILGEEPAGGNRQPDEAVGAGEEGSSWRRLGTFRSATGSADRRWLCPSRLRSFLFRIGVIFGLGFGFDLFALVHFRGNKIFAVKKLWVCVRSASNVVWRVFCRCYTAGTIWPETRNPTCNSGCLLDLEFWIGFSLFELILK